MDPEYCESVDHLKNRISELETELISTKAELEKTKRKLSVVERKFEKSESYNEDLRKELSKVNQKIDQYRSGPSKADKATQWNGNWHDSTEEGTSSCEQYDNGSAKEQSDALISSNSLPLADSLKEAAESATRQSGFVYDETYGMYYDYSTGYYYDPEKCLYYDSRTGIYYSLNQCTNEYEFHSRIDVSHYQHSYTNHHQMEVETQKTEPGKKHKRKKKKDKSQSDNKKKKTNSQLPKAINGTEKVSGNEFVEEFDTSSEDEHKQEREEILNEGSKETCESVVDDNDNQDDSCHGDKDDSASEDGDSEMEEGELSDSSSSCEEYSEQEESSPAYWPPCIRVIVQSSDTLDDGSLYIIPCTGATLGRENNMGHSIHVSDINVSKMHCSLSYDEEKRQYFVKDHASQNGTFVNSVRISEPKVMSEYHPVNHRDIIKVGGTSLLCHIHPGTDTCDECEPGQIQAQLAANQETQEVTVVTKEEKEKQRRKELKNIRKKYGLQSAPYEDNKLNVTSKSYKDKAEERRRTVGSDNPYQKDDAPASVDRAISSSNVGHKMMEKMGWKSGESLGKGDAGIREPVKVNIRTNRAAGLGSAFAFEQSIDNPQHVKKTGNWLKMQKRFQGLDSKTKSGPTESRHKSDETVNKTDAVVEKIFEDVT